MLDFWSIGMAQLRIDLVQIAKPRPTAPKLIEDEIKKITIEMIFFILNPFFINKINL